MDVTWEERVKVGEIYEEWFDEKCEEIGIPIISTKHFPGWDADFDRTYGDRIIMLARPILVDVKGGFITERSIREFIGEMFVVYQRYAQENCSVFHREFLLGIINQDNFQFDVAPYSGQPGISAERLLQVQNLTLEEFLNGLIPPPG